MRTKKKRLSNETKKQLYVILIVLAVIAIAGAIYLANRPHKENIVGSTPTATPKGNSTADEPQQPSSIPTPNPSQAAKPVASATPGVPPTKPVLQKSSGNAPGSSVPTGSVIEFICEGTPGLQCDIILTDRANSSRVLNLGKKPITSNNRGSYFSIWNWNAVGGSWNVVAKVYGANNATAASDTQTLEIK